MCRVKGPGLEWSLSSQNAAEGTAPAKFVGSRWHFLLSHLNVRGLQPTMARDEAEVVGEAIQGSLRPLKVSQAVLPPTFQRILVT